MLEFIFTLCCSFLLIVFGVIVTTFWPAIRVALREFESIRKSTANTSKSRPTPKPKKEEKDWKEGKDVEDAEYQEVN